MARMMTRNDVLDIRNNTTADFMNWWRAVNGVLAGAKSPEMLYGDAKSYWDEQQIDHPHVVADHLRKVRGEI